MQPEVVQEVLADLKITTTKFFGQCWNQDYICGCTDCAKLENKGVNLFSARFRSSESFVPKSVEGLAIARLETREENFPLQDLHSFPQFYIVQC